NSGIDEMHRGIPLHHRRHNKSDHSTGHHLCKTIH
ncbi:unnamed protein product, partial [Allacma fusca]